MYTTGERICHVHSFFQCVPHILDHTPTLENLVLRLRYQPLHVFPCHDVQPLLRFEKSLQLILLQQISRITHKDTLEVQYQIFQCPVVMHVPRGEENAFQTPLGITYPMQLESKEPPLRCLSSSSYLFCYSILTYIVVLAYRHISRVYKMLIVATAVHMKQILYQQADEKSRTVRSLQKVLVIRQLRETPPVMRTYNPMKGLQILHPHREAQQVQRHHFGQGELLFRAPFVFLEVPKLLPEGSMKKSLKKIINECKKNSELFITHTQPPWIWYYLNLFLSYLQEVVNLSNL